MPFRKTQNTQIFESWFRLQLLGCAVICVLGTGCRQRAYTELYVENMASEIRMLEDRIYEYDAAYLEKDSEYESKVQELERLKKKNVELLGQLSNLQDPSSSSQIMGRPPRRLNGQPESHDPIQLQPDTYFEPRQGNVYELPSVLNPESTKPEYIENPPAVPRTQAAPSPLNKKSETPNANDFLPPGSDSFPSAKKLPDKPKSPHEEPQASNVNRIPKRNPNLPAVDTLTEQVIMPESIIRSAQQPKLMVVPSQPSNLPLPDSSPPNKVPSLLQRALPKIKEGDTQGAIQGGKIRLPEGSKVQFASAVEPVANIKLMEVTDNKIVEIAFHPMMCRGHNFDEKPGDDGLYLVLTPINATGQAINETGTLTIIVEDANETKDSGRVARWVFTPEQLAETLEPVGTAQGFHLSLPWKNNLPTSKVVTVYLQFLTSNGRTLINKREIHLRMPSTEQPVWTPRKSTAVR